MIDRRTFLAGTGAVFLAAPLAAGLVENLRKPGGRFTGTYNQATDLLAKGLPCPVRQS
jgi:hypothetical protein